MPFAVRLIDANFGPPALLPTHAAAAVPERLAELGIVGGAVHDGLVGLAASAHDLALATRDLRAAATSGALGVEVVAILDDHG